MKHEDLQTFCDVNSFSWAEAAPDDPQGEGYYFHWEEFDDGECVHVTKDAFAAILPGELRNIVIAGRDVSQITRVVGYYSNTRNWNQSKLGELRDRRAGNYHIPKEEQENG